MPASPAPRTYSGGCHCGAVRFEVEATAPIQAIDCNCSMCARTGFLHLIVPASRFRLLAGGAFADRDVQREQFGRGGVEHRLGGREDHLGVLPVLAALLLDRGETASLIGEVRAGTAGVVIHE